VRWQTGLAKSGRPAYVIAFACSLIVLGLGFFRPAPSGDESVTTLAIRRGWLQIWQMRFHDPALLPYYLVLKAWSALVPSEFALRLPSVIAMSAMVVVVMKMVADFTNIMVSILAGVITLIMPSVTLFAQDARPYAFAALFACLSVRCWLMRARSPRTSYAVSLTLCLTAGILMHAYSATLILVLLISAMILRKGAAPGLLRATLVASIVSCVTALPFLILVERYARGQITAPAVSLRSMAYIVAALPAGVLKPWLAPVFAALALALCGTGVVVTLRWPSMRQRPLTIVSLTWLIVPPAALTTVQIVLGKPTLGARYWEFCLPALSITITLLVVRVMAWRPSAGFVACGLLVLLALPTQIFVRGDNGHDGAHWESLPDVLAAAGLRAFPISMNGAALDPLLIYDHGQYRYRLLIRQSAAQSGLVAPVLWATDSRVMLRAARRPGGLIAYQTRTASSLVPRAADFRRLVDPHAGYYVLRVSCDYFGDSLGVFGVLGRPRNPSAFAEIAREIELRANGHVRCVVE
jgi:Dolichyl-phosphate-mannose-protein mannosyltransferase